MSLALLLRFWPYLLGAAVIAGGWWHLHRLESRAESAEAKAAKISEALHNATAQLAQERQAKNATTEFANAVIDQASAVAAARDRALRLCNRAPTNRLPTAAASTDGAAQADADFAAAIAADLESCAVDKARLAALQGFDRARAVGLDDRP